MSEEKPTPDALTETTADDITLTEADLNDVSGGVYQKIVFVDGKFQEPS